MTELELKYFKSKVALRLDFTIEFLKAKAYDGFVPYPNYTGKNHCQYCRVMETPSLPV